MRALKASFAFRVAVALSAVLLGSGPSLAADEARTLSFRLDWMPSALHSPFYLAAEKGWFKKADLDVSIVLGTGSVTTVQLVNAGQYDVGHASLAVMAMGRGNGMSVTSIACFTRKLDIALLVPAESAIRTPADLKGKKVIFTAGSFEGPFIDTFLEKGGLARSQVELLNVAFPNRVSTYVTGGADAMFGGAVADFILVSAKRPTRRILFADVGINIPSFGIFTTDAMLKKKGEALRTFTSILAGAWTYVLAGHQDEAVQALLRANEKARLDPVLIREQLKVITPFQYTPATANLPIGVQATSDWASAIEVMESAKVIKPGSKPSDYFTNDYLDLNLVKSTGAGN
ncbi:MAG TPA: ABC transporter substrate-binding protein [Burkholderiales bacterium]|jgi:NitT/TauT family transport system substrate-binding protein|nr:ABC transporter substrate-binding protein [Burkholderiales bacterium]